MSEFSPDLLSRTRLKGMRCEQSGQNCLSWALRLSQHLAADSQTDTRRMRDVSNVSRRRGKALSEVRQR